MWGPILFQINGDITQPINQSHSIVFESHSSGPNHVEIPSKLSKCCNMVMGSVSCDGIMFEKYKFPRIYIKCGALGQVWPPLHWLQHGLAATDNFWMDPGLSASSPKPIGLCQGIWRKHVDTLLALTFFFVMMHNYIMTKISYRQDPLFALTSQSPTEEALFNAYLQPRVVYNPKCWRFGNAGWTPGNCVALHFRWSFASSLSRFQILDPHESCQLLSSTLEGQTPPYRESWWSVYFPMAECQSLQRSCYTGLVGCH